MNLREFHGSMNLRFIGGISDFMDILILWIGLFLRGLIFAHFHFKNVHVILKFTLLNFCE